MRIILPLAAATLMMSPAVQADSAFPYSTLGFSLGAVSFDDPIVIGNERIDDAGAGEFAGTYQFEAGPFIGLSAGAIVNEEGRSELTQTTVSFDAGYPVGLNERVDLVPRMSLIQQNVEVCFDNRCFDEDDSGVGFGLGLRAWAVPDRLELLGDISDTTLDGSETTFGLTGGFWFADNHRISLAGSTNSEASAFTVGYRYNWW